MSDHDKEVRKEIVDVLEELLDMGLIEVVGINEKGEWLYQSTEVGKKIIEVWEE